MTDRTVPFDEGEFSFRVSPLSLDDYEQTMDLLAEAHTKFVGGKAVRAFAERFVEVAQPTRDGEPITVADIGKLDPGLILSLGRQWSEGVRNVPLPLPLRSSASDTSPER